ncbi:unnamed protein product [Polarella glacialis]|uniref:Uncharacterized protein n=1 Tax=Polarella glacialis TaxID=89957 RepID=A0A813KFF2_POLGL|nr:unnamed protein product [Polarella glacialis]
MDGLGRFGPDPASPLAWVRNRSIEAGVAQTPESKRQVCVYTPPPAPCVALKQRELDEDVKTALVWNSVPLLSVTLLRGSRGCSCRSRFDHSLHEAVNHHQIGALEFLLRSGIKDSINEACGGYRPLHRAVRMARKEGDVGYKLAFFLLQHGARHDLVSHSGNTPLHEAAFNASAQVVKLLLTFGADPNAGNNAGRTPLHVVCRKTLFAQDGLQDEVAEVLLASGADPTRLDANGFRPADHAAEAASMGCFVMPGSRTSRLHQRLLRAERWWARRGAFLIRFAGSGSSPEDGCDELLRRVPEAVFQAVVRFL